MQFKKFFFTSLAVIFTSIAIICTVAFLRYQSWATNEIPAEKLTAYFERITKSDFNYESMTWQLAPLPTVRFSNPSFHFKSDRQQELRADFLDLRLDLLKLVVGQFGFSSLKLQNGVWQGQFDAPKGVHDFLVEDIELKTSALLSNRPVKVYMTGSSEGRNKAVVLHGEVTLPPIEETSLDSLGFQIQLLTRDFQFKDSPEWEFLGWIPSSGKSDFLIVLRRAPTSDRVLFSGDAGLHELVFRNSDSESNEKYSVGDLQVKFSGHFSPKTDELKFNQCSAQLPFSRFNLQGTYLPHRREFRALTFNFLNVKLDDLTTHFPDFKNKIPYFIGFSGEADLSVALDGYLERLKLSGDFNLTRTLFTYGRFFEKPKDKAFRLKTDFKWENNILAGEFSGNFEELAYKGSLTEWNPSGQIKVNLITNSFASEYLSGVVPFLDDYELGGSMKVFGDWKGNYMNSEPFETMFHLTLQEAMILRKGTGAGFKNMNVSLDLSPLQTEAQSVEFTLGGSPFEVSLKGYHTDKNPKWEGKLKSSKLIAGDAWKEWTAFWGGSHQKWLQSQHAWVQRLILSEDPFENFTMDVSYHNHDLNITALQSNAFGGVLSGNFSSHTRTSEGKAISVHLVGDNMSADKFFSFSGVDVSDVQGDLSWDANFSGSDSQGEGEMVWEGPFSLMIKDGLLGQFNWIKALEKTDFFKGGSSIEVDPNLSFDKLIASGKIKNDRLNAEIVELNSKELQINGQGAVDHDGVLNLRLNTKVDAELFRQLFPNRADNFLSPGDAFFGPVTLLASGPLNKLSMKLDPQSVSELASRFARQKKESLSRYL